MRFILRAQIPTEAGKKMMQNPNGMKQVEEYVRNTRAEAAYFFEASGERTMVFIVNMERADHGDICRAAIHDGSKGRIPSGNVVRRSEESRRQHEEITAIL